MSNAASRYQYDDHFSIHCLNSKESRSINKIHDMKLMISKKEKKKLSDNDDDELWR